MSELQPADEQRALAAWEAASPTFYVGHPHTDAHRRGYLAGHVAGTIAERARIIELAEVWAWTDTTGRRRTFAELILEQVDTPNVATSLDQLPWFAEVLEQAVDDLEATPPQYVPAWGRPKTEECAE